MAPGKQHKRRDHSRLALFHIAKWAVCVATSFTLGYFSRGVPTSPDRSEASHSTQVLKNQKPCNVSQAGVDLGAHDPWQDMKWVVKPSPCLVKGQLIEELDAENNFRRSYTLGFHEYVEDRTHVLPWMLASHVDMSRAPRRVLLDLGSNIFESSVLWFLLNYPLDFTEIYAWEPQQVDFIPKHTDEESQALVHRMDQIGRRVDSWRSAKGVPRWQLDRIHFSAQSVGHGDSEDTLDITRVIKEMNLTREDAVICKMDIEGAEWPILQRWLLDAEMLEIVDELWVEVHYNHPSMTAFGWVDRSFPHTRDEAKDLLQQLRDKGFYVHFWP